MWLLQGYSAKMTKIERFVALFGRLPYVGLARGWRGGGVGESLDKIKKFLKIKGFCFLSALLIVFKHPSSQW